MLQPAASGNHVCHAISATPAAVVKGEATTDTDVARSCDSHCPPLAEKLGTGKSVERSCGVARWGRSVCWLSWRWLEAHSSKQNRMEDANARSTTHNNLTSAKLRVALPLTLLPLLPLLPTPRLRPRLLVLLLLLQRVEGLLGHDLGNLDRDLGREEDVDPDTLRLGQGVAGAFHLGEQDLALVKVPQAAWWRESALSKGVGSAGSHVPKVGQAARPLAKLLAEHAADEHERAHAEALREVKPGSARYGSWHKNVFTDLYDFHERFRRVLVPAHSDAESAEWPFALVDRGQDFDSPSSLDVLEPLIDQVSPNCKGMTSASANKGAAVPGSARLTNCERVAPEVQRLRLIRRLERAINRREDHVPHQQRPDRRHDPTFTVEPLPPLPLVLLQRELLDPDLVVALLVRHAAPLAVLAHHAPVLLRVKSLADDNPLGGLLKAREGGALGERPLEEGLEPLDPAFERRAVDEVREGILQAVETDRQGLLEAGGLKAVLLVWVRLCELLGWWVAANDEGQAVVPCAALASTERVLAQERAQDLNLAVVLVLHPE